MSNYINPFEILTRSISKPQSIALAVVYGVLGVALVARRLLRLAKHKGMYNLLILFSAMLVVFSVIGVIGAVLQIVAINKLDFDLFDTAKSLRIASGALFIFISTWVIVAPIGLVVLYRAKLCSNVLLATTIVVLSGSALMLESVYRVLAATRIDGFILETYSVGVLLVLPEFIVIVAFIVFDLDNLSHITLYWPFEKSEEDLELSKKVSKTSREASEV
ncbi:hypothetical protein A1Q1_06079 [Trichosporon asahii var. asahii CBS 2479]|uniref:Uncharacterized protein n=1 Tax=Trichosporon asahii var. asahii (strain ATCC 90039 / CBS 2479 / JCM 2466 / KCTC 7840 / NBRC 103889/ NCYC 2677 / UAMH 7654) TaxID=1186058 RepID=J5Q4Q4_TRIAS|nr:hypothetical protein A1Q1_06079 [Trichosporon asahii var. asahii CBS 2479]EJT45463.1 hypothetical protein A1Q1_06079 [Trichosporon asahii var. asahii CBS 2479]